MSRGRQKEFWLELSLPIFSEDKVREVSALVRPDGLILPRPTTDVGVKVASRLPGGDILVTDQLDQVEKNRELGIPVVFELEVNDRSDQQRVFEAVKLQPDYLLIDCPDWKIIPLENLIAEHNKQKGATKPRLLARTWSFEESRTALGALELGVDGVVLNTGDLEEMKKTRAIISVTTDTDVSLSRARVESVRPIQMGARVCVDTTELIQPDEGLLVGCSSQALFLVEAEVHTNPHVSPRPFRVNAGPVSLYVLAGDGQTRYLSDLQAGETVLIVGKNGRSRNVDVARVKVERRPMILVEATTGARSVKTILQNAETVRLLGPDHSIPVHELKPGDEVYVRLEDGGRHFGSLVKDEMIIEK